MAKASSGPRRAKPPEYSFRSIGVVHSCFKEKFGIPRQPGLASGAEGVIELLDEPFLKTAARRLEEFSHLWIVFVFHRHDAKGWKPSIRPPRLGGAEKVGVLASRSPHRPNPIGLSAVKLDRVEYPEKGGVRIHVRGVDILDGTPVLDIKPYIPYADSIPDASSGWADEPIVRTEVVFSEQALSAVDALGPSASDRPPAARLRELIEEMLALDPRPAFQKRRMPPSAPEAEDTRYGFALFDIDVKWAIRSGKFEVLDVVPLAESQVTKGKGKPRK